MPRVLSLASWSVTPRFGVVELLVEADDFRPALGFPGHGVADAGAVEAEERVGQGVPGDLGLVVIRLERLAAGEDDHGKKENGEEEGKVVHGGPLRGCP